MLKQMTGRGSKSLRSDNLRRLRSDIRTYRLPPERLSRQIEEFYISLDTPVSLTCLILYRAREFKQLVEKEIEPANYIDRFRLRDDLAAVSLLRKSKFLNTGIDKRQKALNSFKTSEECCKIVNKRFRNLSEDQLYTGPCVSLLNTMIRKIEFILGDLSADELFDLGSWGPGVSHLVKGKNVSAPRKFREECGITTDAYAAVASSLVAAYPRWFDESKLQSLICTHGNKVITVPKNAKTDRTIAIEPGLNTWFQLAIGKSIRRRLGRVGFDLNSDKKNQLGALKGSIDGSLATVDFSSASDTISRELVREILPPRWYSILDTFRSHNYELDGSCHPYEKFSAMGNGFTFELESLIFVCAALAVCEYNHASTDEVSVFGDDIILPSSCFDLYSQFCTFLGFTVNKQKSFSSGYFRESCGSYFFAGLDVKPIFLKDPVLSILDVYKFANSIRTLAHRRNLGYGCDQRLFGIWSYIVRSAPESLRFRVESRYLTSGFVSNFDEARPSLARDQWCGYLHPGLVVTPVSLEDCSDGMLNTRLWRRSSDQGYGNSFDLRSVVSIRFKKRLYAPQWHDYGPWI